MSRRTLFAALGLAALGLVLYLLWGGDDDAAQHATGQAEAERAPGGGVAAPRAGSTARPRLPGGAIDRGGGVDPGAPSSGGTRTYVTDTGNIVRDHRSNVDEPVALPAPMKPSDRTMSSVVTADIYRQLAPVVRGCGADVVGPEARGDAAVVHVTLMVDVVGEELTTAGATAVTSDIQGPEAAKVVACVRERAAAINVAAKGEPDRSGYVVQYPIRLRK